MHARLSSLACSLMLGVSTWLSACSPAVFKGGVFRSGDVAFRTGPVPDNWRPLAQEETEADIASFAFRDDTRFVTVGGAGRCGRDSDDVPLRSLTQHLTLGFTDRSTEHEQELTLGGRAALRTELRAKLDGVPKHLTFVVIKKDLCVYDFWRIADSPDTDSADFDAFVGAFQTVS